jgi:two-component system chemotaxis response regulator CheB
MTEEKRSDTTQKGLRGTISNVNVSQLLQMVCVGQSPLMIRAVCEGKEGILYIRDGQVFHAVTNQKTGEDAFLEIALWDDVVFEIVPYVDDVPQTILKPWEYLALEAARIRDEYEKEKLIHVLIVDDSAFFARQLKRIIEEDPEFVVVGVANNGEEAIGYMEDEIVDVVTLDAFMPVMPGDTTLKHLMIRYSVPVVVLSAFLEGSTDVLFDFMRLGAVDVCSKPQNRGEGLEQYGRILRSVLKKASKAKTDRFRRWKPEAEDSDNEFSGELSESNQKLLIIVGAEGSHMDWFRLPLWDFLSAGYVVCFSSMDKEFIPALAELVTKYKGCDVKVFSGKEQESIALDRKALNFLHARSRWKFDVSDTEEYKVLPDVVSKVDWRECVETAILNIVDLLRERLEIGILCLSGGDAFSDAWLDSMVERKVKWLLPPEDVLLFPDMVESMLKKFDQLKSAGHNIHVIRGEYKYLGLAWKEEERLNYNLIK